MHRLEHGRALADVRARDDAQPADEPGPEVAEDVAVEVLGDDDVDLVGVSHHLHRAGVDDHLRRLDARVLEGDATEDVEEQAVGELHDVRLVDAGDALAPHALGVVEGVLADAGAALLGDELHALRDARQDHELEAGVEVLGVLADDDDVGALEARLDARQRT